ncbi:nucleotidyltransferase domain-containing protein [Desulfonauticus submarinus]|uniref:Nucleotidyltransferase domain-containing protein n=1 Tax=Desulfonauticus submarinus TaxID=206665 RepID=A0A1H0F1B7_9BACT|nr:nucleotidyltransferase domain-containing protein [Desulfonauticus submarinus]SDN88363.1 Nucleotidyltransferase domain-containing protein [Desulfonauticus submarinus]
MATIPNKIKNIIFEFINELEKNNIPIDEIFLFGSYAKGNYTPESDIDLLIVSPIFQGDIIEDKKKIRKYILKISSYLEIIPCSRKEFQKKNPFIKEITKKGLKITPSNTTFQ